jgi:hypothetical protein
MEEIVEQGPQHVRAILDFNRRLREGGSEFEFPADSEFPVGSPNGLSQESRYHQLQLRKYLLLDGEQVRGGYILIGHGVLCNGNLTQIQFLKLPLSEAIVDPQFSLCGALLLRHAVKQAPLMYGLGGGGEDTMVMKMLKRVHFGLLPVPFHFRVLNPARFLRYIQPLRTTPLRRASLDIASRIPLLPWAVNAYHLFESERGLLRATDLELVPDFGAWADEVWERCCGSYSMIAIRDAATLNWRLPPSDERIRRIKVVRRGELLGWVAVTNSSFARHKQFGAMRVGAIVDGLCIPGEEKTMVAAAHHLLRDFKVDLIVSNQRSSAWIEALRRNSFLVGPSNFTFAASPHLKELVGAKDPNFDRVHISRCDGDGPIHL